MATTRQQVLELIADAIAHPGEKQERVIHGKKVVVWTNGVSRGAFGKRHAKFLYEIDGEQRHWSGRKTDVIDELVQKTDPAKLAAKLEREEWFKLQVAEREEQEKAENARLAPLRAAAIDEVNAFVKAFESRWVGHYSEKDVKEALKGAFYGAMR